MINDISHSPVVLMKPSDMDMNKNISHFPSEVLFHFILFMDDNQGVF